MQRTFDHWRSWQQHRRHVLGRAIGHLGGYSKKLCFHSWRRASQASSQQRAKSSSHYSRTTRHRVLLAWADAAVVSRSKVGWVLSAPCCIAHNAWPRVTPACAERTALHLPALLRVLYQHM